LDRARLERFCRPEVPSTFAVTDAASANWVIRKIVEARAYAARVRHWSALEIRRAEREEQFFIRRFGVELEVGIRVTVLPIGMFRCSMMFHSLSLTSQIVGKTLTVRFILAIRGSLV